jgi:hypothetical protein
MSEQEAAGLSPEDFTEGGGLLDDVTAEWTSCRFVMWDYQGKRSEDSPALCVKMTDPDGEEHVQYWSAGSASDWIPSEDGTMLIKVGNASGIRNSTNLALLLNSLTAAGFPPDKLSTDVSVLEGMIAHMVRVAAPERKGLKREKDSKYEAQVLVVESIEKLPWEKKTAAQKAGGGSAAKASKATAGKGASAAAKAKAAAAKKKAEAAEAEADDDGDVDLETEVQDAILGILAEAGEGETVRKAKLPTLVFKALASSANKAAAVKLASSEEFLSAEDRPWVYADGELMMIGE